MPSSFSYNAPQPNAAPIPVYAARDAYAWPSDRAAGAGVDITGVSYAGERVGTFPLWPTATKTTYAYHICSDTFPHHRPALQTLETS